MTAAERHDLLVVGGGASGAATAYWAARHGLDVAVLQDAASTREGPGVDVVTPRAVESLTAMGLDDDLLRHHRVEGRRAVARHRTLALPWPGRGVHPDHGFVIHRRELDRLVADRAVAAGAVVHRGTGAVVGPERAQGHLVGATVRSAGTRAPRSIRAPWIVVADGSPAHFGRALGATRNRHSSEGVVVRGAFESPDHDDRYIEIAADPRAGDGSSLPGVGWILPTGDGTVEVGLGLPPGFRRWTSIEPTALWHELTRTVPDHWEIDPDAPLMPPRRRRLPRAGAAGPEQGPN